MIETTIGRSGANPALYEPTAQELPGYEYFADQWASGPVHVGYVTIRELPTKGVLIDALLAFPNVYDNTLDAVCVVAPKLVIDVLGREGNRTNWWLEGRHERAPLLDACGDVADISLARWTLELAELEDQFAGIVDCARLSSDTGLPMSDIVTHVAELLDAGSASGHEVIDATRRALT